MQALVVTVPVIVWVFVHLVPYHFQVFMLNKSDFPVLN